MRLSRFVVTAVVWLPAAHAGTVRPLTQAPPLSGARHYAQVQRARALAAEGRVQQAAAVYDTACANAPFDSRLWVAWAVVLDQAGRHAESARAFAHAFEVGVPFGAQVEVRVARELSHAGSRDSALAWIERALRDRYEGRAGLYTDSSFAALRDDPRFIRLAGVKTGSASRDDGWRRDIDFLVAEAQRLHVGFDRPAFSDGFLKAAANLRADVPSLSDDRIRLEMRALLTLLGDGHTDLFYPFSRLPVDFYQFSDGLFIVRGTGAAADLVGAQVLAFGALPVERAMREVRRFIPRDNDMGVLSRGAAMLGQPIVLSAIGAARDTATVDLTIRERTGRTRTVSLTPAGPTAPLMMLRPPAGVPSPPLYMSEADLAGHSSLWFRAIPASHAVYLQYNAIAEPRGQTTRQFAESLKTVLRETRTTQLIVDVRNNGGGNTFLYPPLLDAIIYFREAGADRRVWVIIGRRTFSAAQNFATTLERYIADAVFVGEPTGSRPNFVGESPTVVLPYSGLRLAISSRYHQNQDITDKRMWIAPQVPTPLSSADYFANRDPAMDAILELIGASSLTGSTER